MGHGGSRFLGLRNCADLPGSTRNQVWRTQVNGCFNGWFQAVDCLLWHSHSWLCCHPRNTFFRILPMVVALALECHAGVVATWLFDEQRQAYPSSILNDCGPNGYVMALGRGARLAPGRFGNALE